MAASRRVKLRGEESPDSTEHGVGPQGPSRKAWWFGGETHRHRFGINRI